MHVHTSQDGQLERRNESLVGQKIRRGDPDRTPRRIDRGQKDQNQLIDLLIRPGDDRARRPSAARRLLMCQPVPIASSPVVNDQSSSNSCSICRTIVPSTRKGSRHDPANVAHQYLPWRAGLKPTANRRYRNLLVSDGEGRLAIKALVAETAADELIVGSVTNMVDDDELILDASVRCALDTI